MHVSPSFCKPAPGWSEGFEIGVSFASKENSGWLMERLPLIIALGTGPKDVGQSLCVDAHRERSRYNLAEKAVIQEGRIRTEIER
jgi:hypothetical protein